MIDTLVRYVSSQTSVNVFRIDAIAIASGIAIAGIVPNTKRRIRSAAPPPINASVSTLGPCPPPLAAAWSGSRPVSHEDTPAGVAFFSAARVVSTNPAASKDGLPVG